MSLLHSQRTQSIGLNDLWDSLQLQRGPLASIRGTTAPSRNGLAHANRERPATMAEQLFWRVLEQLKGQKPGFAAGTSLNELVASRWFLPHNHSVHGLAPTFGPPWRSNPRAALVAQLFREDRQIADTLKVARGPTAMDDNV